MGKHLAGALLAVLAICGCSQGPAIDMACFKPAPGNGTPVGFAIEQLSNAHGDNVSVEYLALALLRGLSAIDPQLNVRREGNKIIMGVLSQPVEMISMPVPPPAHIAQGYHRQANVSGWREKIAAAQRAAKRLSPVIAGTLDGQVQKAMIASMLAAYPPPTPLPCSGNGSQQRTALSPFPGSGLISPEMRSSFIKIVDVLDREHIDPVPPGKFVLDSLLGLSSIDQGFSTVTLPNGASLSYRGVSVARLPYTSADQSLSDGLQAWAGALESARKASNVVARVGEDVLFDKLVNAGLERLGTQSRYKLFHVPLPLRPASIGASLSDKPGCCTIVNVLPGAPAARAGLSAGDAIIAVDGMATYMSKASDVTERLRGGVGSTVSVIYFRKQSRSEVVLTREITKSIAVERHDGIVNIATLGIDSSSAKDIQNGIASSEAPPRGIVLDLRGNGGGVIQHVLDLADQFIARGPLLIVGSRKFPSGTLANSKTGQPGENIPLVILVDGWTSGGAMAAAAALQANGAVLVGTSTRDSAVIYSAIPLQPNAGFFPATGRMLTPSGQRLDGIGVAPNLCTANGTTVESVLAQLDDGRAARASLAARGNDQERLAQRGLCPPSSRAGEPMEMEIAARLLGNPVLLAKATGGAPKEILPHGPRHRP